MGRSDERRPRDRPRAVPGGPAVLAGGLAALGLLWWLYRGLDIAAFLTALAGADPLWLAVLALAIVGEQLIRGWKWRQILFDLKPLSSLRLFAAIMAGYGVGILVPLGISPLARSWLVARLEGLRMATVLVTTAIDRFLDAIAFSLFVGLVAFAGPVPEIADHLRLGLSVAGAANLVVFGTLLWLLFSSRDLLQRSETRLARLIDWIASLGGRSLEGLRVSLHSGILWPRDGWRQYGIVMASLAMKVVAATHFLWAGLAVGVTLAVSDYLFLFVFAGFSLLLARFIRVPGGFVIGSAFALKLLGVPDEKGLAMILFIHVLTLITIVGAAFVVLWWSGLKLSQMKAMGSRNDADATVVK